MLGVIRAAFCALSLPLLAAAAPPDLHMISTDGALPGWVQVDEHVWVRVDAQPQASVWQRADFYRWTVSCTLDCAAGL